MGLDLTFDPNADGQVMSLAVQSDGKILLGGYFTTIGGVTRNKIARLNSDGSLDTGFNPSSPNYGVFVIAPQSDGKLLIGGEFTTVGERTRNRIARLNADGGDDSFDPNVNNEVWAIAVQSDGKILIGGKFTTVGGQARYRLSRVNSDGSLDTTFNANLSTAGTTYVYSIAIQPDGKILIGGRFFFINGVSRNSFARLNSDGSLDTSISDLSFYAASGQYWVKNITIQPDGKILIGGDFDAVLGVTRYQIVRLNSDGTIDTGFNANVQDAVSSDIFTIALQTDGKILFGGYFATVGGIAMNKAARVNSDGSLDTGFVNPNINTYVRALKVQSGGDILVGGDFNTVNGIARNYIARWAAKDRFLQTAALNQSWALATLVLNAALLNQYWSLAANLSLKMSNFQGNAKSGEPSYLSVTIPNALQYAEAMAEDHSGDDIIIRMGGKIDGVAFEEELLRVNYESLRIDNGAKGSSMILTGHKQDTNTAPKGVLLSGISYIGTNADGTRRVRCKVDFGIRAGDQAYLSDDDFFTVDTISYQVGIGVSTMEIAEA